MPAESLRWDTLEALKNSSKGKLKYNTDWLEKGEGVLESVNTTPSLSAWVLRHLSSRSPQKAAPSSPVSVTGLSAEPSAPARDPSPPAEPRGAVEGEEVQGDAVENTQKDPDLSISLLSARATQVEGCIRVCEKNHRDKAQELLRQRLELQEEMVGAMASRESEQLKRFEELMELKRRQEYQSVRDMLERSSQEALGRQEKLKEEHRHRMKIQNLKLREAELQRLREAELERQRQVEGRDRLRRLNSVQEEVLQLNTLIDPNSVQASLDLTGYSVRGNQLCGHVSEIIRTTAEGEFPSAEDMARAEGALQEMRTMIDGMRQDIEAALEKKRRDLAEEEEKRKQLELQRQQEVKPQTAAPPAEQKGKQRKAGLQTSAEESTLKWYKELQELSRQCAASFEELNSSKDMQTKKLRMELQKASSIPVSQISSISGSKLREIFDKIDVLLSCKSVQSAGRPVSASQHPQGLDFVSYKLAEKFVKQGEEEVASHHEAAFPIAVVASGIWERHPKVGDLILAHLHKKCPYSVPCYPPMKEGTSVEEYQRILGYRVDDIGVEAQDSFLKRMSGMIRLYAAVIQLRWPYGNKQAADPHGLNHGWRWLAQMLNMEPLADITATLLFDFLEVCGNALMKQYQGQFWKLILMIKEEYFPRIEAVTTTGQMGSVMRLKQFLEDCLKRREIPVPKGHLSSSFWRS